MFSAVEFRAVFEIIFYNILQKYKKKYFFMFRDVRICVVFEEVLCHVEVAAVNGVGQRAEVPGREHILNILIHPYNLDLRKPRKKVFFLVDSPLRPLAPHPWLTWHSGQKNGYKLKRKGKYFLNVLFFLSGQPLTLRTVH